MLMKRFSFVVMLTGILLFGAGSTLLATETKTSGYGPYTLSTDYVIVNAEHPSACIYLLNNGVEDWTTEYQITINPYNFYVNNRGDWFGESSSTEKGWMIVTQSDPSDPLSYGSFTITINGHEVGTVTVYHGYW